MRELIEPETINLFRIRVKALILYLLHNGSAWPWADVNPPVYPAHHLKWVKRFLFANGEI